MTTDFVRKDLVLEAFCERTKTTKEQGTIETYIAQFKGEGIKIRIESEDPIDKELVLGSDSIVKITQNQTKLTDTAPVEKGKEKKPA